MCVWIIQFVDTFYLQIENYPFYKLSYEIIQATNIAAVLHINVNVADTIVYIIIYLCVNK